MLDGRYTQVLKDGFPLYSGFSQGLGISQIAPLNLKQIEIIKGSSQPLLSSVFESDLSSVDDEIIIFSFVLISKKLYICGKEMASSFTRTAKAFA